MSWRKGYGSTGMVCAAIACGLLGSASARAAAIVPASYAYTNGTPAGETGYGYTDSLNTKLTDGNVGTANATDGSWVGWEYTDSGAAEITFNFASSVTIASVSLDFLRQDGANTQLPESVTIGGTNFATTDFATDNTRGYVNYTGSWTGNQLVITLNHTQQHWIFLNEAQFNASDVTATPEPRTIGLALAAMAGIFGLRRRQNRAAR